MRIVTTRGEWQIRCFTVFVNDLSYKKNLFPQSLFTNKQIK